MFELEPADNELIARHIEELAKLPTFPSFCYSFYRIIADYVAECHGPQAEVVRTFFDSFLHLELRYYRELESMVERDHLSGGDMQSLSDKRRIHLEMLIESARYPYRDMRCERARHLILAECHYHLHQTDKVVAHLEWAVTAGADASLVYFALGYNRFHLALESFVHPASNPGEWYIVDYPKFQDACLQAVSAFEKALTGGEDDAELYQWIARVLRSAGFPEAADAALANIDEPVDDDEDIADDDDIEYEFDYEDEDEDEAQYDQAWPGNRDADARPLQPISAEEIEAVGELLKGSFSVAEVMGRPQDHHG